MSCRLLAWPSGRTPSSTKKEPWLISSYIGAINYIEIYRGYIGLGGYIMGYSIGACMGLYRRVPIYIYISIHMYIWVV